MSSEQDFVFQNEEKFSMNSSNVKSATIQLLLNNLDHLLKELYENKQLPPFNDPVTRVGIAIKMLIHSESKYDLEILQPVVDDITSLLGNEEYLNKFGDPETQQRILNYELDMVNKMIVDDNMSLNSTVNEIAKKTKQKEVKKMEQEGACLLM